MTADLLEAEPRPVRRRSVAVGVAVVLLVLLAVAADRWQQGRERDRLVRAVASAEEVVARSGAVRQALSRVEASARVVAVPGRPVRLCADAPVAGVGYEPGQEPPPDWCEAGVDVERVDLAALSQARTKEGATEGWAAVEGVFRGGVVVVDRQDPYEPARTARPLPPDRVPCPEPEGGWPAEGPGSNLPEPAERALQDYLQAHPEQQAWLSLLRPATGRLALGVAVHDDAERAEAERLLRPAVGEALCLVDPVTTREELAALDADPALRAGPGEVFSSGTGLADGLEPEHTVGVIMVTPQLRAAADKHRAGLVRFEPTVVRKG